MVVPLTGQSAPAAPTAAQAGPSSFQGSVAVGEVSAQPVDLTLDDAIQRGLKNNLGVILSAAQTAAARGQRLSQLQALLPSVDGSIKEAVAQTATTLKRFTPKARGSAGPILKRNCHVKIVLTDESK